MSDRFLLCALVATLLATPAWADTAPKGERAGTFKQVEGSVTATLGSETRKVRSGDAVFPNDRIQTAADGAAALTLRDGTELVLGPQAQLQVAGFEFEPTTQSGSLLLSLLHGSLRMVSGLIAKLQPEKAQVKTPTLVIGLRGTDFIVEAP